MSGTLTPYGRKQLLVAALITDLYELPDNLYLAHTRIAPVDNATGSQLDEPSTGYARALIGPPTSDTWIYSGFAEIYNAVVIPAVDATADWGLLTGYAIVDSEDPYTGNVWAVGSLSDPYAVDDGEASLPIDIGGLAFGLYD